MMTSMRQCTAAILLTPVLAVGCDSTSAGQGTVDRSDPALAGRSFVWSAEPNIDLLSGPAVPVRAYLESSLDTQTMGEADYAYPGFATAVQPGGDSLFTENLVPDDEVGPVSRPPVGTTRFAIQSVRPAEGGATSTVVCTYRYTTALEESDGRFASLGSTFVNDDGIDVQLVRLTAPADSAMPPQSGPARAPVTDVFGGWKVTGFLNEFSTSHAGFGRAWPTYDADLTRCVDDAPDSPERRQFLAEGTHPRGEFPTLQPYPGWPEADAPNTTGEQSPGHGSAEDDGE